VRISRDGEHEVIDVLDEGRAFPPSSGTRCSSGSSAATLARPQAGALADGSGLG